jgi:hypothetical protein
MTVGAAWKKQQHEQQQQKKQQGRQQQGGDSAPAEGRQGGVCAAAEGKNAQGLEDSPAGGVAGGRRLPQEKGRATWGWGRVLRVVQAHTQTGAHACPCAAAPPAAT